MKTDLELRHLRVFVAVVENGTHTRAARALGLSQSTVSETLSALERTLGVTPFKKTRSGLALTASGEVLLAHARALLAQAGTLVSELAQASRDVSGTVVVSTVESVSAYLLPPRLTALRRRWPKMRVQVITAVCDEIRESVAAGKSELGLVLQSQHRRHRREGELLARSRLLLVGAGQHPLAGTRVSCDEVRRAEYLMCDSAGDYHEALRKAFESAGLRPPKTQSLGTIEGVKQSLARDVSALSLLPRHAIEQELRSGKLGTLDLQPPLPVLELRALCTDAAGRSPVVRELVDSLRGVPEPALAVSA